MKEPHQKKELKDNELYQKNNRLQQDIKCYIEHLKHERKYSVLTCLSYERDLNQFLDFVKGQNILSWQQLSIDNVRLFFSIQRDLKKQARSLNRKRSALRSFFDYLLKKDIISDNLVLPITSFKTQKLLPKPLDADEVAKLLQTNNNDFIQARDAAVFELMYSAGLRLSETISLKRSDIDLSEAKVYIKGKGQKERIGFIGKSAEKALHHWLRFRELYLIETRQSDSLALFITKQGKGISARSVQHRLLKLGQQQGMLTRVHPHRLRHSFASHLLESSQDLRAVQELLGHAHLSSTQIYTQLNFQHLASIYDKCHPRARK